MKQSRLQMSLAFFGFALIGANGGAMGVLLPSLSNYYKVDNSVIGLLFLASSVGYFLSALSSSLLLEWLGLRKFLLLGTLTFLLGTLTFGIMPPFIIIIATRLFLGFGVAIIETGLNAYVVALPRHTPLLNSLHAFYGAGALLGPVLAAALLSIHWGWNAVYLSWSLLSLPLLLGFAIVFVSQPLSTAKQEDEPAVKGNILIAAIKLPVVWVASVFLLIYVGVEVSLGNWTYSFLVEGQHQQVVISSFIVSGYWLGLTLGRFTLSNLAERFGLSDIGLIYSCMVGILIGIGIVWLFPFELFAAVGFCFIGFSLAPIYPTTVALLPKLVPKRIISSAIGFLVSLSILGLALFPWLAGILAQSIGIWSLLPYVLLLTVLMLVFWWAIFRISPTSKQPIASETSIEV